MWREVKCIQSSPKGIFESYIIKTDGILDTQGHGVIMFRNILLINVIRQITEKQNWTFEVDHDNVFQFKPFSKPKHSGITITDKDIKSIIVVKGFKPTKYE